MDRNGDCEKKGDRDSARRAEEKKEDRQAFTRLSVREKRWILWGAKRERRLHLRQETQLN